jgi:hypothetical protein
LIATALLLQLDLFVFEFVMSGDRVVGPIFQESDDRREFVACMKDIAATRHLGHGTLLAGANAGAEIGDRGLGSKAAILTLHQTKSPGIGVALIFGTQ